MAEQDTKDTPQYDIDWLKTAAGALAAVTTAVLLSTLGAVGTLVGAALGSVAATVGSAIYAQGLARSKQAVLKAQETAMLKVGVAQTEVRRAARRHDEGEDTAAEAHLGAADERLDEARAELAPDNEDAPLTWGQRLGELPWKRIGVFAAGTFLVVMLAIFGFEKIVGNSVAGLTGGSDKGSSTTFGGITGNDDGAGNDGQDDGDNGNNGNDGKPSEKPTDEPTEETSPSEEATSEAPTEAPTESPSATTPTETPSTTPSPTTAPSPTTSSTPSSSPSATATTSP